jgi:glycerol kinase
MSRRYVAAIDQGTTSTRFMIFDRGGECIASAGREHRQIFPQPGWVEHDPLEIWRNTLAVAAEALQGAGLDGQALAAVGLSNQRETTLLWDRRTGAPLHNALVWQDTRVAALVASYAAAGGQDRFRAATGLPLASYFSALKLRWLLDELPGARALAEAGVALFGTIDSWLVWNLTGGSDGGLHLTDVTNASRTQLMSLATLDWSEALLEAFAVPRPCLPRICASSEVQGEIRVAPLVGVPLAGILGDQQAALFGQTCFEAGEAKNTYGTGCFLLMHTGAQPVASQAGLITTVACRRAGQAPQYALEGSIAIAGALVQWLRDNLGLIARSDEIEALARSVGDNGDVYFVPAFSGLYAPWWNDAARGLVAGLTRHSNKGHIARAALEASAYQTCDVVAAMERDSGIAIRELRADGGMVVNELLMQFQADMLGVDVVCPRCTETTALGAAYAAGLAPQELEALRLSLAVATRSVLFALPVALLVALLLTRRRFVGRTLFDAFVHLPLVLPPVVVGYLLLLLFGARGPLGRLLYEEFGIRLVFSTAGAALATAVMSFPLMVRSMRLALEGVDPGLEEAARTLGASRLDRFFSITLPLMLPGVLAGAITAFAASLGEFGAVITFVSNIPGETRTLPLALYTALQSPGGDLAALRLAGLSFGLGLAGLLGAELFARGLRRWLGR